MKSNNKEKILLVKSQRKTGFLGFIICLQSVHNKLDDIIKPPGILDSLLTYKLSQDHLEMFFSAIRARRGFNNNPTTAQFESSYKRLLVHTELITNKTKTEDTITNIYIDMLCAEDRSFLENGLINDINIVDTVYITNVVEYISGFIVRKVQRIMNRGLKQPSADLVKLCKIAEKIFKHYESNISKIPNLINYLIIEATSAIDNNTIFISLSDHILNQAPMNNHLLQLLHLIFKTYFIIHVHHYTKLISQPKERFRSYLTKTIHFKNQ
ncbi:THAP-type domain-containing protein [Aphis craccivora]|uniref:THAP-type domain-containing protein n=1 Tax=Aphis craccivora TaxID=307492 RepID=A0A6G0YF06_APHCR|nr:THAP-type domain-containing protein [Aphis craccivora]